MTFLICLSTYMNVKSSLQNFLIPNRLWENDGLQLTGLVILFIFKRSTQEEARDTIQRIKIDKFYFNIIDVFDVSTQNNSKLFLNAFANRDERLNVRQRMKKSFFRFDLKRARRRRRRRSSRNVFLHPPTRCIAM